MLVCFYYWSPGRLSDTLSHVNRSTLLLLLLLSAAVAVSAAPSNPIQFSDATAAAGITFVHNTGRAGKKYLPETVGSGCAFFDADGDGWPDILLVNSKDWQPKGRRTLHALYRNNKNGTFTDVTAGSGLDVEMYGIGVSVGDFDNDGRDDVYITALEGDRLFHNDGHFKFRDVTKTSGIANASFGTSAAWLDYDKDGRLDLFVANYVKWSVATDQYLLDGRHEQDVLYARDLQGVGREAVSQRRRRQVRGRESEGRDRRCDEQVAGRGHPRLRRRRLA